MSSSSSVLLAMQRAVFMKALPLRQLGATTQECEAITTALSKRLPELVSRHAALLPADSSVSSCKRAPVHLERGCLAVAAWQSMHEQAAQGQSALQRASPGQIVQCVGAGFGIRLEEDGSKSDTEGIDGRVNNAASWFGKLFTRDAVSYRQQLIQNFKADLGVAFVWEETEPAPNFVVTRCLYHELACANGAPELTSIFWAEHQAAFASVESFTFEGDCSRGPECYFRFDERLSPPSERIAHRLQQEKQRQE